jgi:hypothetical protein
MDNWFIFQYRQLAAISEGATRKARRGAAMELPASKSAGRGAGKSTPHIFRGAMASSWRKSRASALGPFRPENPLNEASCTPVPQTDSGGRG